MCIWVSPHINENVVRLYAAKNYNLPKITTLEFVNHESPGRLPKGLLSRKQINKSPTYSSFCPVTNCFSGIQQKQLTVRFYFRMTEYTTQKQTDSDW